MPPSPKRTPSEPPARTFRGPGFRLALPEGWEDRTVYVIQGPVQDNHPHSITVVVDSQVVVDRVQDFADMHIRVQVDATPGCRLLTKELVHLTNGLPGCRAVFAWDPCEGKRLYREQLFVLDRGIGYIATATFAPATRRTLGPAVRQAMLQLTPLARP